MKARKNRPVNDRFHWAQGVINPRPQDQILEIGCGAGLMVEQITARLETGIVTAIDRSASMIKMAEKRNSEDVASGKVKFMNADFVEVHFKENEFDKAIAFNVNFFWKNPGEPLEIIRRILKPTGLLFIFYQAPFDIELTASEPISTQLRKNSFTVIDTILKKMSPTSALCIKAKPRKS